MTQTEQTSSKSSIITLSMRAGQRVARGYPWIFRSDCVDLTSVDQSVPSVTYFANQNGKIIATGYTHAKIQLTGRVLAQGQVEVNQAFFVQKFKSSLAWRAQVFPNQECYRLVHAESDGLPGLIIDRFFDTLVIQINSAGMEMLRPLWLPALQQVLNPKNIVIKNDSATRLIEGLEHDFSVVQGEIPSDGLIKLIENNVNFYADVKEGQKTGWFFDQRPHRAWVAQQANNKNVLDVFSHTGGFGITAACNGAKHVTCVDSSQAALDIVVRNAELNNVNDRVSVAQGKAFDLLETLSAKSYDIVCVDPPAFVKSKKDMTTGLKGYEKLARISAQLVNENGLFFFASCSSHPTEQQILEAIFNGISKTSRQASLVYQGTAGPDHPMHASLPETRYLKAFAFRII